MRRTQTASLWKRLCVIFFETEADDSLLPRDRRSIPVWEDCASLHARSSFPLFETPILGLPSSSFCSFERILTQVLVSATGDSKIQSLWNISLIPDGK
jgi:hypothetical protein